MAEFKRFMDSIENKSDATKKQYRIQYNKLLKLTEKPIAETSEKKIIELLNEIENKNNSQALLNIALLVRKLDGLSVKQLEEKREKDKKKIFTAIKEKNVDLRENLPDYKEITEYTDYLFEKNEFTELINEPHFEALVSDAFWYFICSVIKPDKKYEAHNEFLLDRMAANYVSYTLVDKKSITVKTKNRYFDKFYNHLA